MLADDMACNARNPRPGRFLVVHIIANIPSNPTLGICKKGLEIYLISIYTLSDLGVLSNLIGSLSLANKHYSPPTK